MKPGFYRYHATQIPLYGCLFHILVGHDLKGMCHAASLPETGINGLGLEQFRAFAFTGVRNDETGYFVLLRPDASANTVAHESVHVVNKIFADRGIKLDIDNDEPQAYLTGWVAGEINYALISAKIKPARTITLL